jgi:hypothetical protein
VDDVGWMKKKQKNVVACICSNWQRPPAALAKESYRMRLLQIF